MKVLPFLVILCWFSSFQSIVGMYPGLPLFCLWFLLSLLFLFIPCFGFGLWVVFPPSCLFFFFLLFLFPSWSFPWVLGLSFGHFKPPFWYFFEVWAAINGCLELSVWRDVYWRWHVMRLVAHLFWWDVAIFMQSLWNWWLRDRWTVHYFMMDRNVSDAIVSWQVAGQVLPGFVGLGRRKEGWRGNFNPRLLLMYHWWRWHFIYCDILNLQPSMTWHVICRGIFLLSWLFLFVATFPCCHGIFFFFHFLFLLAIHWSFSWRNL